MRFVNPYVFVPPSDHGPRDEKNVSGVGETRSYHQLNRYQGMSGRIDFTLTNLSPLFIPDSEQTRHYRVGVENGEPQYHKVMDFFNVGGRLALPGTSLKGMFRAVAEALSNSSFGVFKPEKKKYTFRKLKDFDRDNLRDLTTRKWGMWTVDHSTNPPQYSIRPLESAKILRSAFDAAAGILTEPAREAAYSHLNQTMTRVDVEVWQLHTGNMHVREFTGPYTGTVFSNTRTTHPGGMLLPRVTQSYKSEISDGGRVVNGPQINLLQKQLNLGGGRGPWPVVAYQTVEVPDQNGTPTERVCQVVYRDSRGITRTWDAQKSSIIKDAILWPRQRWDGDNMDAAAKLKSHYLAVLYPAPGSKPLVIANEAISSYQGAYGENLPGPDQIVRYYEDGGQVMEVGPAAMFKTPENASVDDLARRTRHLLPPTTNAKLCPATRLFGWTPAGGDDSLDDEEKAPVAGRVRVGTAWGQGAMDTILTPLKILGSPKPSYYPYYLRPRNSNTGFGYYTQNEHTWWGTNGRLRGRKFYVHHPQAFNDHNCGYAAETDPKQFHTNQNVTAALLPPGGQFRGYLEFDSLSEYELGMLLWTVALSDNPLEGQQDERVHKLGLGRPLGLGSVRVSIDRLSVYDPTGGWLDDADQDEQLLTDSDAERLVKVFKTWMMSGSEEPNDTAVAEFDYQDYYRELCAVLRKNLVPDTTKIRYPVLEYFAKQRNKRKDQKEESLCTATEIGGDPARFQND